MERIKDNVRWEIIIDYLPIGYILLNSNNEIEFAELYDNFIHSKEESNLYQRFFEIINKYEWVDKE